MVTDPTQSIRRSVDETPFAESVRAVLDRLAALPPSPAIPYLTVTLDWRTEGTHPGGANPNENEPELKRSQRRNAPQQESSAVRRPARAVLDRELQRLIDEHGPRGDTFDSLTADAERISAYLDKDLDPAAHGAVIVACSAQGAFEALALALKLPTRVTLGPLPAVSELARVHDDHPTFAVLLADQHEANLTFITHASASERIALRSTEYPRKQHQGGWSQRRFQARADERVNAFARDIAAETRKALEELNVGMLIVAGDEVITSALDASFHQTVKDRRVETLRLDIRTSDPEIIEATMPVAAQAERDREAALVERLLDAGEYGAGGAQEVLTALQAGQVATLVMVDDFQASGWADFTYPTYGVGDPPAIHPLGGDSANPVAIDLRESLVYLALNSDADFGIIHSAAPVPDEVAGSDAERAEVASRLPAASALDTIGGVGAILRFPISDD